MRVTVLGSGDAFGSGGRRQSAYLVETGDRAFLLDAGPTVLAALSDAGRSSGQVDFVLISHLHGDHFAGVVFMIMEFLFEERRDREFLVIGPEGVESRVKDLYRAIVQGGIQSAGNVPSAVPGDSSRRDARPRRDSG